MRLEQENPREICVKLDNFNSIKVRLEPNVDSRTSVFIGFQFHKGAIRTKKLGGYYDALTYFNSIKVRLELVEVNGVQYVVK